MELEFVAWLIERFGKTPRGPLRVGIGDDAAVLEIEPDQELVVTTDMLMEGVHFDSSQQPLALIGRKAVAVGLSDLAAMAARPLAAFVSLALPAESAERTAPCLIEAMADIAQQFDCVLAGGDTNCWSQPLVIDVCLVGCCPQGTAWLRRGARPGDQLVVTGSLGGSLLGKHLSFEPRVRQALYLRQHYCVHAACDLSDGLALDLRRLCKASGCGALLQAEAIPVSEAAHQAARSSGRTPLEHALGDGEDFELLLALPPQEAQRLCEDDRIGVAVSVVGTCTQDSQVRWQWKDGRCEPLPQLGYCHGARS